jgi:hypothetical protein
MNGYRFTASGAYRWKAEALAPLLPYVGGIEVHALSPALGAAAGGTTVTLLGANFLTGVSVAFGTHAATVVTLISTSMLTCVAPAGVGPVSVVATNVDGKSATAPSMFTYAAPADYSGAARGLHTEEDVGEALRGFLAAYFDGGVHDIGGGVFQNFPLCRIAVGRLALDTTPTPIIILDRGGSPRATQGHPSWGKMVRYVDGWRFQPCVYTRGTGDSALRMLDLVAERLYALLFAGAPDLNARSGIRLHAPSAPSAAALWRSEWHVKMVQCAMRYEIRFDDVGRTRTQVACGLVVSNG